MSTPMPEFIRPQDRLVRHSASQLILTGFRQLKLRKRVRLSAHLLGIVDRLEKGGIRSVTSRLIMWEFFGVEIGAYSYGQCFVPGYFTRGVKVGRYTSVAPETRVYRENHPMDWLSTHPFFYDPRLGMVPDDDHAPPALEIGHDSWIGYGTLILPGCKRIGIGAVVGARAVVTKDVPDFAIVAGNPAKLIRYRFEPQVISAILASQWWEKPIDEVKEHLLAMRCPVGTDVSQHPLMKTEATDGR